MEFGSHPLSLGASLAEALETALQREVVVENGRLKGMPPSASQKRLAEDYALLTPAMLVRLDEQLRAKGQWHLRQVNLQRLPWCIIGYNNLDVKIPVTSPGLALAHVYPFVVLATSFAYGPACTAYILWSATFDHSSTPLTEIVQAQDVPILQHSRAHLAHLPMLPTLLESSIRKLIPEATTVVNRLSARMTEPIRDYFMGNAMGVATKYCPTHHGLYLYDHGYLQKESVLAFYRSIYTAFIRNNLKEENRNSHIPAILKYVTGTGLEASRELLRSVLYAVGEAPEPSVADLAPQPYF